MADIFVEGEYTGYSPPTYSVGGVYKKVNQLMKRLGAVEKGHTLQGPGGGYKYRSYTDLFTAMQPIMIELGLVHETQWMWGPDSKIGLVEMQSKSGIRTGTVAAGVFRVTMIDVDDGSRMSWDAPVVGMDTSDKAGGKAASYGIKTALFTGLQIPIEDEQDHDAVRPQAGPGQLANFVERARKCASLEELKELATEARDVLGLEDANRLKGYLTVCKEQLAAADKGAK